MAIDWRPGTAEAHGCHGRAALRHWCVYRNGCSAQARDGTAIGQQHERNPVTTRSSMKLQDIA
ncbi:MAG: hypothetical protein KDH18_12720, partial [Rhodoferax sp.]|nr:hypothetical protein [Rhodoferax sp.]